MVSHQLMTPLAAVKGSITTLLETADELHPTEMTQFFRIIHDQSDPDAATDRWPCWTWPASRRVPCR